MSQARVDELLARMTLEEKAFQLTSAMSMALRAPDGLSHPALQEHLGNGIGHVSAIAGGERSPGAIAALTNGIQRFLREETRLGIPAIVHAEALSGVVAPGFTAFPTGIGLAATWDPEAIEEMAGLIREQMRAVGLRQALSPVMDIARDPRWGRVHETYGEDVYLACAMSVAYTRGLQGDDLGTGVIATGKHFLGYALTEAGQNLGATQLGPRELHDVYAAPFHAAIALASLGSVMNSYSEIDGVPVGANRAVLTDLLRGRMGFTGAVTADYSTIEWLQTRHRVAETLQQAGVLALEAGLDIELPTVAAYGPTLVEAVRSGAVAEHVVDRSVRLMLLDKFALGLFDNPYVDEDPIVIAETARRGDDLSQRLAEESITLLKNDGALPISAPRRILVVGPHAETATIGFAGYTYPAHVAMMEALARGESRMAGVDHLAQMSNEAATAMAEEFVAVTAEGTESLARQQYDARSLTDALRQALPDSEVHSLVVAEINDPDPGDLDAAVRLANDVDLVVLAIGGRAGWFGTDITEGEGTDVAHIELPETQVALAQRLRATGTPIVGVVFQGRPLALTAVDHLLDAVLIAYYPGPAGAEALAAVITGATEPTGRLPYTMPRATGQIPIYYSQHHGSGYQRTDADMFHGYIDLEHTPLYPFGHGLGYTTFEYGELTSDTSQVPTDDGKVRLSVRVRNTGDRAGTETVQLYASTTATGVTRPAIQLAGFARASIPAGGSAGIEFEVELRQLGHTGLDGRFDLQPGPITFRVGASSARLNASCTVEVTGPTADLEGKRGFLSTSTVSI